MDVITKAAYVDLVQTLAKATGSRAPKQLVRSTNAIHDKYEPIVLKVVQSALRSARNKWIQKFKVDKITSLFESLKKSTSDDIKAEILAILESSLDVDITQDIIDALAPMVAEMSQSFSSVHDVDLNFRLVDAKAIEYLTEKVNNDFSTLADNQAKGVYSAIADAMTSEDGYSIKDIVSGVKDAWGLDKLYFPLADGSVREMDATVWATGVARTETARAASYSTKSIIHNLGLMTWTWYAQETACDDCLSNDGETVAVGDEFPSGDTESPAHNACRCLCTVNSEELTSLNDDQDDDEETDTD